MTMESTWETRELPVLEAAIRYFDDHPMQPGPTVADIAQRTRLEEWDVFRAVQALSPTHLELKLYAAGGRPGPHRILRVTDQARRAVGQWPSADTIVDRLVQGLIDAADQEPDEQKKSRLRSVAEGLGGFARDVAVGVISSVATKPLGM
jgi:hypothetical protein